MSISTCPHCGLQYDQDTDVEHEEMCNDYQNQGPFAGMNKVVNKFFNEVEIIKETKCQ